MTYQSYAIAAGFYFILKRDCVCVVDRRGAGGWGGEGVDEVGEVGERSLNI